MTYDLRHPGPAGYYLFRYSDGAKAYHRKWDDGHWWYGNQPETTLKQLVGKKTDAVPDWRINEWIKQRHSVELVADLHGNPIATETHPIQIQLDLFE